MNPHFRSPSQLLAGLLIQRPEEIDLEIIAHYCGALVVPATLTGCEGRLLGLGERAYIRVDQTSSLQRQRFSIAHELGHWMHDRGRASFQCTKLDFVREWGSVNPEQRANRYAADLLMPVPMFRPLARNREMTLETVANLASSFRTSLTSTAIRLVEHGSFPAAVLCSTRDGIRWRIRGSDVPAAIWFHDEPTADTVAFDILRGEDAPGPTEVIASAWMDVRNADRYSVVEDSQRVTRTDILTILWWKDESQLMDFI